MCRLLIKVFNRRHLAVAFLCSLVYYFYCYYYYYVVLFLAGSALLSPNVIKLNYYFYTTLSGTMKSPLPSHFGTYCDGLVQS